MENQPENKKTELGRETLEYLRIARKWSMFLARLGFIFLIVLLVLGAFTGTFLTVFSSGAEGIGLPGTVIIILLLIIGIFYVLPVYHLWFFSKHLERALKSTDSAGLHKAFRSLKSYFVYLGVLAIVVITIYIVIVGVGGALMAFLKVL